MAEVDFATASVAEIAAAYFDSGSILLRNFANVARLRALVAFVDELYGQIDEAHIFPHHLKARSLPQFHEYIFEAKHHALLREILQQSEFQRENLPPAATREQMLPHLGGA